jgi:Flp pilus assembly secretin CpaC
MRRQLALTLVALVACPSSARSGEEDATIAPAPHELRGPLLPAVADESREVVRLASAVESGALTPEPPQPVAEGAAATRSEAQLLLEQKVAELERLRADIDELRIMTGTPQLFYVNIEVLEVSRTKMRKLGMDLATFSNGLPVSSPPREFFSGLQSLGHTKVARSFIDSLKENNLAKSTANPCIVTLSGRPATMQLGGTFPVPAAPGAASAVEFQEYGTKITIKPQSLCNDRVRLEINPRLSELDPSHSIEINGQRVPGLRVTEISTATEMRLGETFVFGGLSTTRIEAHKFEGGRVEEVTNEIETWLVVSVEDVSKSAAAQRIAAPEPPAVGVPYSPSSVR